jgi:hypothetical protein
MRIVLMSVCILCNLHIIAQSNIFKLPEGLPKPNWYNRVNWEQPNVHFIDSLIQVEKKNTIVNSGQDKTEGFKEENPYVTAYLRWRNEQMPFIQKDGSIKVIADYYKNIGAQLNQPTSQKNITTANWTPLGPLETFTSGTGNKSNTQTNIYSFAISSSNPNIVYAGSETGVLFKSIDKGANWVSVNDNLGAVNAITAIGINPLNNDVYYFSGAGLFISTNGGTSFTRLNNYTYGEINRIVFNETTGRLSVASVNGVYYSDNAGLSWTLGTGSNAGTKLYDIAKKPGNPNTIYAVGVQATSQNLLLFTSTDGG